MKKFDKQPFTNQQQLNLLKDRKLIIPDESRALRYLDQISYYRLSAYFLIYQQEKDVFNSNVCFDDILNIYRFDRELRLLIFDCIERVEIAIRTQVINTMSQKYSNSHWQDNPTIFKDVKYHNEFQKTIKDKTDLEKLVKGKLVKIKGEPFIEHYRKSYNSPKNPPSWMCLELLTIGEVLRLYNNLKNNKDKQLIANHFQLPHKVFSSWVHSLNYVRNICAHHARLWNREFAIKPLNSPVLSPKYIHSSFQNNARTFYFLCTLKYLLKGANPNNHLTRKLEALFAKYPTVPIQYMGIPTNQDGTLKEWKNQTLWNTFDNQY